MRKIYLLALSLLFITCYKNSTEPEKLNLSASDVIPLNDSTRQVYYNDAVYIEYMQNIAKEQTINSNARLDDTNIQQHYTDLINIYQASYTINKRFVDNITKIHNHYHYTLRQIHASVDTNKTWVSEWLNGNRTTGIAGIDSVIENYELNVARRIGPENCYNFTFTANTPLNTRLLVEKLSATHEFLYVETPAIIPAGGNISLQNNGDYKTCIFKYGWGDCLSGCLNHHTWEIKVKGGQISLIKEYGDLL